jgi:hypothetical protein
VDISAVMDEVAVALATIPTLGGRAYAYFPDRITPPSAWVDFPEVEHDATFARGADRLTLPAWVAVSRVDSRTARDRLLALQAQVKTAIESYDATAYHSARVTKVDFNHSLVLASVDYTAAQFTVDIIGTGA